MGGVEDRACPGRASGAAGTRGYGCMHTHLDRRERGHRRRVLSDSLGQYRGQLHLSHHIEGVVGAGAIRAERHVGPGVEQASHRAEPGGELEVGCGAVRDGDPGLCVRAGVLVSCWRAGCGLISLMTLS
jgi:hypothetical protein